MNGKVISKGLRAFIHKSIQTFIRVPLSCTVYKYTMYVCFLKSVLRDVKRVYCEGNKANIKKEKQENRGASNGQ